MPKIGGIDMPGYAMPALVVQRDEPTTGEVLASAARDTINQVRYGVPYAVEKAIGSITPEREQNYQQNLAQRSLAPAASLDDLTSGKVGFGGFIKQNLAASLPYMVGSLAGSIPGIVTRNPELALAGAVAGGTPQFLGSNVDRAVQEQGGLSQQGAFKAMLAAPVQAAADVAVERYIPGLGGALGFKAIGKEGAGFLRRTATSIAKAGATEAGTEAGQQVLERWSAGIPVGGADATAEYVNAAVTAFALGGVLGAGGGFRRTNTLAKAPDQVTNEDLDAQVDGVLSGELRALPAPADFIGRPDGQTEVNPSGRTQLMLPPPERFQEPAPEEAEPPAPTGAGFAAYLDQLQQNRDAAAAQDLGVSAPFVLRDPTRAGTVPIEELPTAAQVAPADEIPFDQHIAELKKGLRGGFVQSVEATDEMDLANKVYDQIFTEQDGRANTAKFAQRIGILDENLEPTPLAQMIEQERTSAAPAATTETVAAPELAQDTVVASEEKKGARQSDTSTGGEVASVTNLQPGGIVGLPAPTSITPQVEKGSATYAEFSPTWDSIKKEAGIGRISTPQLRDLNPQNMADLEGKIFNLLATDDAKVNVSQVEKVAKTLGLITNDSSMDITPVGRQVFLTTPAGLEETVSAAQEQGYSGAQASIFERGVREHLGTNEAQTSFASFEDMAAYQAGKNWAQDFTQNGDGTRTAAQTSAIQSRILARSGGKQAAGKPIENRVENAPKSPAEVQRRSLNELIDRADLGEVSDQDVVALRRMVADGATPQQVGQAIQKLQGGGTLRMTPPTRPAERSIAGRGQPVFKEMNTQQKPANEKAQQRAETEGAVETLNLRNAIQHAVDANIITQVRADKLHDMLDAGDTTRVARLVNASDKLQGRPASRRMPTPAENLVESSPTDLTGGADLKLEQAITGKSFDEVLDHMIVHAPSKYMREVMKMVKKLAGRLQKAGFTLDIQVVKPGDTAPRAFLVPGARAYAQIMQGNKPGSKVWLKSSEVSASGVNYQTVAHEMIHAVAMQLLRYGNRKGVTGHIAKATQDLYELSNAIINHFNARAKEGNLTKFEQRYLKREHNALQNVDEVLAWGLVNPEMQRYLASIEYTPKQSVFGKLVDLLRNLLGLDVRYNSALTELLRVSEHVMQTPIEEIGAMLPRNDPAGFDEGVAGASMLEGTPADHSARNRTVGAANEVTKQIGAMVDKLTSNVDLLEMATKGRRKLLGWLSHNQIDRKYGHLMPGLLKHSDAHRERVAVRARFEQMGDEAYQKFEKLEREKPDTAKRVGELMALTTEFQVDPFKAWEEHTHLDAKDANARKMYDEAVKLKNDLSRGDKAGIAMFNEFRALNEAQNYARMAASLHQMVATDREYTLGVEDAEINPVDKFMRVEGLTTPEAIRDHWKQALDDQVKAAQDFLNAKMGEAARGTADDQRAARTHYSPIELQIDAVNDALKGMRRSPYFHLGRYGDYFGSATISKKDGRVDPNAQRVVALALEKAGFSDVQISADNTRPKIALRFETLDQARRFQQVMAELKQQGHLDPDSDVSVGPRNSSTNFGVADNMPEYVARYIQSIEASPMFAETAGLTVEEKAQLAKLKSEAKRMAVDNWLDMQPDSSISKVLVKRYTVPGYDKDMIRNFAHRFRVGSISIANVAAAPKFNQAYVSMMSQVEQAKTTDVVEATRLNDIMTEMKSRDASNPVNDFADTFDKARAFTHSYFLGMSPAYAMINMTQLGVTALPELAKQHGYAKSFHAMRRASTIAFKIMKAATSEARALGPKHWADMAITETILDKAGLTKAERNFALHMLATGTIDIGSAARALGQVAEDRVGTKVDVALKYASAMGMYTETFSRLTTAMAARELYGDRPGVEQYATKVVSNSMFDYQSWNTARQLGKKGFLGPVTPLVTQFMSYSVQLTEKLYSEAFDAFTKQRAGETAAAFAARKQGARRFLAGHLTAVTALAGTLGLPFATVFASVMERMADMLGDDDDPFDATAAWRNFLADVLGKDVAEVVARGLPHAIGLDLSQRAGEQNILPFSEFIADRRPWKDKWESLLDDKAGATLSMAGNIITGGEKLSDGDLLGGMKEMLPVAFKGPLEAYRMSDRGYVDTKGNVLPTSPQAQSYLWQLLGFTPDEKAEYQEARADQAARRGEISRAAGSLRKQIYAALDAKDMDSVHELVAQAHEFDQANPGFAISGTLLQSYKQRQKAAATARFTKTPLGVSMKDIAGQQMTRYANTD